MRKDVETRKKASYLYQKQPKKPMIFQRINIIIEETSRVIQEQTKPPTKQTKLLSSIMALQGPQSPKPLLKIISYYLKISKTRRSLR